MTSNPITGPFSTHTGPNIGPCAPASFSCVPIPGGWRFSSEGTTDPNRKLFPAVEWYCAATSEPDAVAIPLAVPDGATDCVLCYDLLVNGPGWAVETDLILIRNKLMFNRSFQHLVQAGILQVADVNGDWESAVHLEMPTIKTSDRIHHVFDPDKSSTIRYSADNVVTTIPYGLWNVPAMPSDWTDGAYIQIQMGSLPSGDAWSMEITNLRLEWS